MTMRPTRRPRGLGSAMALVLIAGLIALGATLPAGADQRRDNGGSEKPPSDRAKGLVYDGLEPKDRGPCREGFRVRGLEDGSVICTHGPDPAPHGVDVTQPVTVSDLASETGTDSTAAAVPCVGDGVSGERVQVIYAVASDVSDRYASVAPLIVGWAASMDSALNQSAAETGGERHFRFVANPDCSLNVAHVVLSPTGDDTFGNTVSELRALGFNQVGRKYLVWTDASVYCGIAQLTGDESPGATNAANTWTMYARVDSGCWGRSDHLSELHELMHTLGAVQTGAPHATAGYHCTDEGDAMCYADAAGVKMTYTCPTSHEWLLDCNHDDYFNTAPPPNSYLATHWNVANSLFLTDTLGTPLPSPSPSASPSPSPSPTVAPTTGATATASFGGSITGRRPTKTFPVTVAAGDTTSTLEFTGSGKDRKTVPQLRLRILAADGTVVDEATGPSAVRLSTTLAAGSYMWEVSGASQVSFSLSVTYVTS